MNNPRPIVPAHAVIEEGQLLGATSARDAQKNWLAIATFMIFVLLPLAVSAWYLWTVAADRYASRTSFSIRSNETTAPLEIFGTITQLGSSSAVMDGEILYDFIRSQQMLDAVRERVDLTTIYHRYPDDLAFALSPDRPVEDLLEHWDLMTTVSIDGATGILSVETRAFTPQDAKAIASAVLQASAQLVNEISEAAREDSVRYAALELSEAEARLRSIRTDLRAFRDLEQDVDPTRNAEVALGLIAALEEDRAQTKVQLDQLRTVLDDDAPRAQALSRRLAILDARIAEERTRLGTGSATRNGRALADVVGDYEELVVDREFAEQAYTLALATFEQAQAEARRQNRYLAVHIRPTLSESADYPDRPVWLATIAALCFAVWAIFMLIAANIRERR